MSNYVLRAKVHYSVQVAFGENGPCSVCEANGLASLAHLLQSIETEISHLEIELTQ